MSMRKIDDARTEDNERDHGAQLASTESGMSSAMKHPWLDTTIAANGHQVRENFDEWFAASKVRGEDSQPMVVYHGTHPWEHADGRSLGNVTSFDRMASVNIVRRRPSIDTVGAWFSTGAGAEGAAKYGNAIYPVYLSIAAPYETTFMRMLSRARLLHKGVDDGRMIGAGEVEALRTWLKATGRDGIRIVHDGNSGSDEFRHHDAWIALEPEQIKSAIGNSGLYQHGPSLCDELHGDGEVDVDPNAELRHSDRPRG
jgi:hypothetical protein